MPKITHILVEAIQTELSYQSDLATLLTTLEALKTIEKDNQQTATELNQIIQSYQLALDFSNQLVHALRKSFTQMGFSDLSSITPEALDQSHVQMIDTMVTEIKPTINIHIDNLALLLHQYPNMMTYLATLTSQSEHKAEINKLIFQNMKLRDLTDFLIMPAQRICKYPSLSQNLPLEGSTHEAIGTFIQTINEMQKSLDKSQDISVFPTSPTFPEQSDKASHTRRYSETAAHNKHKKGSEKPRNRAQSDPTSQEKSKKAKLTLRHLSLTLHKPRFFGGKSANKTSSSTPSTPTHKYK